MAVASLDIQVDARSAVEQLKRVNQESQKLEAATNGATQALNGQQRSLNNTRTAMSGLVSGIAKLTTAYIGLRTAQQAVQAGIQREESSRRLQFLAKGYGEVAAAQDAATRSGKLFGLSATESNQQFAQLYGRLRPLNVSIADIEAAFVGFNTAAKVSGATTAETAGALLQLTQALGSGVLRGQELNSVLEQAPGLVIALTKELNAPISEIRELAEQGKITSDIVIRALKRAGSEGADELAAAMQGPAQQVKNLQNAFEDLQVAATDDLLPAIVEAIKGLREVLQSLGPVIKGIGGIAAQTLGTVADLINAATKPRAFAAAKAIRGGRLPLAGLGGISGAEELFKGTSGSFGVGLTGLKKEAAFLAKERRQSTSTVLLSLMQNRLARMDAVPSGAPSTPAPTDSGRETKEERKARLKREKEAERARKIAEKQAELVAESSRSLGVAQQQFVIEQRLLTARKNNNEQLVLAREAQKDLLAINAQGTEILVSKDIPAQAKANQIAELRYKAKERSLLLEQDLFKLQEEQAKKDQELIKAGQDKLQTLMDEEALLRAKLTGNEAEVILQQQLRDLMKDTKGLSEADVKAKLQGIEALKKQIAAADQMKQLYLDIGSTIKDGVVDAIQGAIDGTKSLGDVASQVLRSISAKLIDVGVNLALFGSMTGSGTGGGLLGMVGLGGKRAMGGSVSSGRSYLVGERGPELFTPGRSGGIAPSGTFGATNVVVNVDASGSSVQGDAGSGAALGRVIAAAVQSELVKQKRPGGILA